MPRAPGEGTIYKRTIKRKNKTTYTRWQASINAGKQPNGKRYRLYGPQRETQTEALEDLKNLQDQLHNNNLARTNLTLNEYLTYWLKQKTPTLKPRTIQTYASDIKNHIQPLLGHTRLRNLTPTQLLNTQTHLLNTTSPAVTRKVRAVLHAALHDAIRLELITRNPLDATPSIAAPRAPLRKWTPEQAGAFLQAAQQDRHYTLFYFILTTGVRAGEALGLKWSDIHDGAAHINRQLMTVGKPTLQTPKTKRSRRRIPLGKDTLELLEEHKEHQQTEQQQAGSRWINNGLVFTATNGQPLRLENIRNRHFNPIIQRAGVPKIRIHDLRHYHLSRLLALGIDIATISRRAGHSRNSTTLDIYVDAYEEQQEQAAVLANQLVVFSNQVTANSQPPAPDTPVKNRK